MNIFIILLRFVLVFVFALIFGLERQRSHKPIGFGTFIFVSLGACGLSITSLLINVENPLPLLGAIITGIGFLGAGALIKTTDKIFGFTTAASIWVFSIIGLIIGVGEYFIGCLLYGCIWAVIFIDQSLEKRGVGSYRKKLLITANRNFGHDDIVSILKTDKYKIFNVDINKKDNKYSVLLLVEGSKTKMNEIPKRLYKAEWVDSFKSE